MNSNDLSKVQAKKMHTALVPALRYRTRLAERLDARSFSPDDRLYRAAFKAQTAIGELVMVLHLTSLAAAYCASDLGSRCRTPHPSPPRSIH
jgi:hypothetical protein